MMLLQILNHIKGACWCIPASIQGLSEFWTCVKKLDHFLSSKNMAEDCVERRKDPNSETAVEISYGFFLWGKEKEKDSDKKDKENKEQVEKKEEELKET